MENTPAYDSLAAELADAGVVLSLPELHGSICGVMCMGGVGAAQRWLDQCIQDWQPLPNPDVGEALRELELCTWRTLAEADLSFEPLLPDDDEPLEAQVRGLALWCHGFLAGLGFGGLKAIGESDSSEVLSEITKDFSEISRAALGEDETEELQQAGFALAELKEYVRVSVQLVFEQCGGSQPGIGSESVH